MESQPPPNKKGKTTLYSFFIPKINTRQNDQESSPIIENQESIPLIVHHEPSPSMKNQESCPPIENQMSSPIEIERDPGKRKRIHDWPLHKRDEVRRAYLSFGPHQPKLEKYEGREYKDKCRHFQHDWFKEFNWLEYSSTTHKAYCFPCFLFGDNFKANATSALVSEGFDNWKRVHQGKNCAFLGHIGLSTSSPHGKCVTCTHSLMKPSQHIDKVINRISKEEVKKNRLRLTTSIKSVRFLALQGCAFRGHNESENSLNRGNVIELIDWGGYLNENIRNVVLKNAPKNSKYTSPDIQKEILAIMANRVRRMIREEIGDAFFSLLVDEAQDESHREQMSIILRYVNSVGVLTERFFAIKSVSDTSSETLKGIISKVLSQYDLQVHKLRGQGYDGASNMCGQWGGLQALFLRYCPYAYYVHCFAHRLQLTLVAAAKQCDPIWDFFSILDNVINIVKSSAKRQTELQVAHRTEIEKMLASGERESGRGANQTISLQRSGSTRWSSHYESVQSMIELYAVTSKVLEDLISSTLNAKARAEIRGAYYKIKTFDFVFGLKLMTTIMRITDFLCQAFQKDSVDILAVLGYLSTARTLLQELTEQGWEKLIQEVTDFCLKHEIPTPDLNSNLGRGKRQITLEHHYHFEVFNECIDFQLTELNSRFNEKSVRLLELSVALDPKNSFQLFNEDNIYKLAVEFYPDDFDQQERHNLTSELQYYKVHVVLNPEFQVSSLAKLCEKLVITRRADDYKMITRLIRLVLTLPVSTATTERSFSAMKHVKTAIRNKMDDEFLADSLMIYIGRELVSKIDIDYLIDEFAKVKDCRVQLTF